MAVQEKDWFEEWFNSPYYHVLYQHRDETEAIQFINNLLDYLQPPKGATMLDLACGKGRHAKYLAEKGFEVTGLDLAIQNIQQAKKEQMPNLHFQVHDMRAPYQENAFDYIFNFFTSFGYFEEEEENHRVVKAMAKGLKPGGTLVIDFLNAHSIMQNLNKDEEKKIGGITFQIKKRFRDNIIYKCIEFEDKGKSFYFEEKLQALQLEDFKEYFTRYGLQLANTFGDYDLNAYKPDSSPRLIMICQPEK